MKRSGGWLVAHALEQLGIRHCFGIPGVHTTEIYDALSNLEAFDPILVTSEFGASFMADGYSRTSESIGALVTVPAAGTTHAASGIGEAMLDGIPMLVISGGIRRDSGKSFQLHAIDQEEVTKGLVKGFFLAEDHASIVPTIFEAYDVALQGEPGPVFVEVPSDLLLFSGDPGSIPDYTPPPSRAPKLDAAQIDAAVELLKTSDNVGLYVGWGARDVSEEIAALAERLQAPVATTMQGLGVLPEQNGWFTGFGFGPSAVPAAVNAFRDVDTLVAVGVRFAELATGSYGMPVPKKLIHIDINRDAIGANYPAPVGIHADANEAVPALLKGLEAAGVQKPEAAELKANIARDRHAYYESWCAETQTERVSPGHFFRVLRSQLEDDAYMVVDDGNHTFLTAELFPPRANGRFLSPTDFNAMGYCVPAAIGVKFANPDARVVGIVGDGAVLMSGLELLTASTHGLGVLIFVFHDGELAQISQFQQIPMNRKTCTVLNEIKVEGIAMAAGAAFLEMGSDADIERVITQALELSDKGQPVLVDVKIDYSKKTRFTQGVVKTNLSRFPLGQKFRFIGRAIKRHTIG